MLQYILYKIYNTLAGWFVHLCHSNSLRMAPDFQNMKEFLYTLCTLYHKVHLLEYMLICKLCLHDRGLNKIYRKFLATAVRILLPTQFCHITFPRETMIAQPRLRMREAILLLSHTPLWCGQGQLYCLTFICPKIITSVWKQIDNLFCKHKSCEKI